MKVVIKVGSQAILSENGDILEDVIKDIVKQVATLLNRGIQVVLVSSGAVALGRSIALQLGKRNYGNSVADKQLLASLGQHRLMAIYSRYCEEHGLMAAQLLLTKYDFLTKRSYSNINRLLQKSISQPGLLAIVNENDSVAVEELMFTDNDELSGIVAAQIGADKLLLLTSVDGVYDRNPQDPLAQLLSVINLEDKLPDVAGPKSLLGRGGMSSKLSTARKMANIGVMTHIANIAHPEVITELVLQDASIGTRVLPLRRKSGIKKYLAFNSAPVAATITIKRDLTKLLARGDSCISILPVGIVKVVGNFGKGDLIEILDEDKTKIGVGIARYSSLRLCDYLGGNNHPVFIHYDYLHLNPDIYLSD